MTRPWKFLIGCAAAVVAVYLYYTEIKPVVIFGLRSDYAHAIPNQKIPAGLDSLSGYTASMSAEQLRKNLVARPTTYLLGQVDILPLGGFDSSPTAMAQGPTRRARGEAFVKYVNEILGAKHNAIIVSECGHNDRCVFTTDVVLPVIFP